MIICLEVSLAPQLVSTSGAAGFLSLAIDEVDSVK
jgi:hypothetical protein